MQRWRYKVIAIRDLTLSESKLTHEGELGWELVSVVTHDGHTARAFFKQPADSMEESAQEHVPAEHHAVISA